MAFYVSENACRRVVSLLVVLISLASPCNSYVTWIYPTSETEHLVYNYIDTVYFTWISSIVEPYFNLWCAPNSTSPQDKDQAFHTQVSTNGTTPQSFNDSRYFNNGVCHVQVENLAGTDFANAPKGAFSITSNDAIAPQTWGLFALQGLNTGFSQVSITPTSSTTETSSKITATFSSPSSLPSSAFTLPTNVSSPLDGSSTMFSGPTAAARPSQPPHSQGLDTGAKAGVAIGSVFSGLALVILVLLFRLLRSRRKRSGDREPERLQQDPLYNRTIAEVGEGTRYEINGIARPYELQGVPRAELSSAQAQ